MEFMIYRIICFQLMMLVDYGGSILPIIAHSPWNSVHLANFVMPFFLFIAGVSLALGYKVVIVYLSRKTNLFAKRSVTFYS